MVEINLLPWRQQVYLHKQKNKKIFLLVALLFSVFLFGSGHIFLLRNLAVIVNHTQNLEIKNHPARVNLNPDIDRLEMLVKLRTSREKMQQFLAKIERAAFYSIQLARVHFTAKEIIFDGYANSIEEITTWLQDSKFLRIKTFKN